MAEITFDPSHVSQCASEIQSHQKTIISLVEQATSTANGLSDWQGTASDQFRSTFNSMSQKLSEANNVISSYISFLNQAVEDWETANSTIQSDVSSFENGQ